MKRFTATEKWAKEWYQHLKPRLKCLWQFICDHADACGVWEPNFGLATFQIGEKVTAADLAHFGDRLHKLPGGKYLVVSFVHFQYGTLSEACPAHKAVFRAMEKNRVTTTLLDTLRSRVQEEDKDKEGEEEGGSPEGGAPQKTPPPPPASNEPAAPEARKVAEMFGRKPTTPWSAKELAEFVKIHRSGILTVEALGVLAGYYAYERQKGEKGIHRRDMGTFLNNFAGELDRANAWAKVNPNLAAKQGGPPVLLREPPGWIEWAKSAYPNATLPRRFWDLETSLQREFREANPELGWKGANYTGEAA